jgi:hypothetical protein
MNLRRPAVLIAIAFTLALPSVAQDLPQIESVWKQTLDALGSGNQQKASTLFADFNRQVRAYSLANGRNWQIEYLTGSLNCQFPQTRKSGAQFLNDILQNNKGLNEAGIKELRRQITACTSPTPATTPATDTRPDLPRDIADASAHFQSPGVHGDMKGGYNFKTENEAAVAISPIPAADLMSRRVPISDPQRALSQALLRLGLPATGATVHEFAVTTPVPNQPNALAIGNCLTTYAPALKRQFQIEPSKYMVTVYTADSPEQVYRYASKLHGLQLPQGVVAYSVPEDMSLAGVGSPQACGSLAHELVHLLIKGNFPVSPAWLEEGLASQVAVAYPKPAGFQFAWSWRDDTLAKNLGERPKIAELLEAPWSGFSPTGYFEMPRAAAMQATAAVFIRYLDSKGKLSDVYFAVRDRHISSDLSQYKSYQDIVEEQLGMNIAQIDADFAKWFDAQRTSRGGNTHTTNSGSSGNYPAGNAPPQPCNYPNSQVQQKAMDCTPQIMNQKAPDPPAPPK